MVPALRKEADVYVISPDTPEKARRVQSQSGVGLPILLDPRYTGAKAFDLAGQGRPMGGLVGYVVIDAERIVREQVVDIDFGDHAKNILHGLRGLH